MYIENVNNIILGENVFYKLLKKGRRMTSGFARVKQGDRSILALSELIEIYKPEGESKLKDQEIPIELIVGSEDRGNDFAEDFIPTHEWMKKRWVSIWNLMQRSELGEPIKVFEYGGIYFVRDGHHRVSTAKNLQREFIRAEITSYSVPFTLSSNFKRSSLNHFRKLCAFHRKTGFLSAVPEADFDIKRDSSWDILEQEINDWNPAWYKNHSDETGPVTQEERHKRWYDLIYQYILKHITRQSLHYLYPGWGHGDVALHLIQLWNTFPNPDLYTVEDMYRIFLSAARKTRFLLLPWQLIVEGLRAARRTDSDERCLFLQMSRIKTLRPEFRLPADLGKRYWRRLHRDLFKSHYNRMRKRLGRSPNLVELVEDWYDHQWLPRTE